MSELTTQRADLSTTLSSSGASALVQRINQARYEAEKEDNRPIRDGEVLTFTFLYNGPRDEAQVREAFDQIVLSSLQ